MALALRLAASHEERHPQPPRGKWSTRDTKQESYGAPPVTGYSPTPTPGAVAKDPVKPGFRPIRVSNAEKAKRSRKGLCYHCPEKWVPGHVCKQKMLCYVGDDGEDAASDPSDSSVDGDAVITADLSHLHAMAGGSNSRPFQVIGAIGTTSVSILIDTGSTHDFLHPRIAEQLHLALTPIRPFRVYVGNGASLLCSHVARRTKLTVQGVEFLIDLNIMEIHGPDIVLGLPWLESLGKVSADFVGKTLEFQQNGVQVALQGVQPSPRLLTLQSLAMLASHSPAHEFYELIPLEPPPTDTNPAAEESFPADTPPAVKQVLESFFEVFTVPAGMPPRREFDHRIHRPGWYASPGQGCC